MSYITEQNQPPGWYPESTGDDGGGQSITVEPLSVTENGTYTAPSGTAYAPVTVDVGGDTDRLKTVTVTLTQDYPQSRTVGTTLKNLFDTAIGTGFWVAYVSSFPAGEYDLTGVVTTAIKLTSLNVANMQGYDTDVLNLPATSPTNASFARSYSTEQVQGFYSGPTSATAYSGMTFTIWGWNV